VKINNFPLDPSVAVNYSQQGKAGNVGPASISDVSETAFQLMFDNQISTILNQLTKLLNQQATTLMELPAAITDEVKQLLQQPLAGEQVVAKGLAAMLQGQKTASLGLAGFANTLNDAATIKAQFPGGLPETWSNLIAQFEDQISQLDSDIGNSLLALAKELTDNPTPVSDASTALQQAGRQLLDSLSREQYTIPRQDFQTKLPDLLKTFVELFRQELAQLPLPIPEQWILSDNLQQICQQLLQDLSQSASQQEPANNPIPQSASQQEPASNLIPQAAAKEQAPPFVGLPAIIDDIIAHLESQLVKMDITFEKDVLVTNLRQILSQLTQDLDGEDQSALSRLAGQMQDNMPEKIRTAAELHNLPELKEVWVLQRMAASRQWLELPATALRQAGQTLKDMNTIIPKQFDQPPDSSSKMSLNLAVPLYFGEEKKAYPAYIHIFQDQEKTRQANSGFMPETWLRLCLSTENVGVVDMVFHVYGQNQLNIRINFSDIPTADRFKTHMNDILDMFDNSPLTLADFTVNPLQADGSL
jgi:hypothetical protein